MGLILIPSEIKNCADQVRANIEKNREGYAGALQVIEGFAGNEELKSESWDTAKQRIVECHQMIVMGIMAAQDSMTENLSSMEAILESEHDLYEDELLADILRLQEECERYENAIETISSMGSRSIIGTNTYIFELEGIYQQLLSITREELLRVREKLEQLYLKSNQSSDLFLTISTLLQAVDCAINDAEVYITGTGTLSDGAWKVTISEQVRILEERKYNQEFEEILLTDLETFTELYGEETISKIEEYIEDNNIDILCEEGKEKAILIVLEITSGCHVSVESGEYVFDNGIETDIRRYDKEEIQGIVGDIGYADISFRKKYIWNYLDEHLDISDVQIAAIMGNMMQESRLSPTNAQEFKYKGTYNPEYISEYQFDDGVGWGLVQWTYDSRKKGLYEYANDPVAEDNRSLGDMKTQLDYLIIELETGACKNEYAKFVQITDIGEATVFFCKEIERAGEPESEKRKKYAGEIYNEFADK